MYESEGWGRDVMEMERDDENITSLQSAQTDNVTDDCASLPPFNQ